MDGDRPRLRGLEAFPIEQDGRRLIALRDPGGFTDQVVVIPAPLLDLVSLFDGEHSIAEMQSILTERHGAAPTAEQIAEGDQAPAVLLDRERFEVAEPGPLLGHG